MEKKKINLEKIKKIKQIKVHKKICIITSVIVIVLLIFTVLLITDKNTKIFGGKLANTFGLETKQEKGQKEEIEQRNKAVKVAIEKFEQLGESIEEKDLEVLRIQRKGELYYYISAKENTVEVRISDNKITRINSVPVE